MLISNLSMWKLFESSSFDIGTEFVSHSWYFGYNLDHCICPFSVAPKLLLEDHTVLLWNHDVRHCRQKVGWDSILQSSSYAKFDIIKSYLTKMEGIKGKRRRTSRCMNRGVSYLSVRTASFCFLLPPVASIELRPFVKVVDHSIFQTYPDSLK